MKLILHCYNIPFTCKNLQKELYKFWIDKIIQHKNSKIWLTISVNITSNTTFTFINNLPFNTVDYNDVFIVLENNFKANLLLSKADMLNYITISYKIENKKTKYKNVFAKFYLYVFSILILVTVGLYYYYIFNLSPSIVDIPIETINDKPNKCIFSLFSEIFKITNSPYKHYPSYFMPCNLNHNKIEPSLLNYIRHEQYLILKDLVIAVFDNLGTLPKLSN